MAIFYTDSGSFNILEVTGSTILSGSLIVSGTTNFGPTGLTGSLFGTSSLANSASFVEYANIANKPALISASSFTSPSQGTVRATINGVQTDVDTGLQTGDSPSFTTLNVSTVFTASIISASTAVTASGVQLNGLTDITTANKVLVLNTATNQIFTTASVGGGGGSGAAFPFNGNAVITGSLVVSGSSNVLTVFGSGSTVFKVSGSQGTLFEVIDSSSNDLFTISSGSIDIFKIDNLKNVHVSGTLKVNGPTILSGSLIVSSSNNSPVIISGSTDSFFELEVVNFSAGNNASSDIVVSSNNTTDSGNYIDLGINSTTFNGPLVGGASDGYLYFTSSVGELDIGNASPTANGNVRLFAGGPNSAATTRVFISASGNVGINTTTNLRNTLAVNGSVSASSVTGSVTGSFTGALTHFSPSTLKLTVGTTAPASPSVNDLWVDTN